MCLDPAVRYRQFTMLEIIEGSPSLVPMLYKVEYVQVQLTYCSFVTPDTRI